MKYLEDRHFILRSPNMKKLFGILGEENVRFVGGIVRNAILNDNTYTDIDLATPLTPNQIIELLKDTDIKVIPTGINHGTLTLVVPSGVGNNLSETVEITTLRKDVETDGRHAEIEFTDNWKEDASRRDFTINAIYAGINLQIYDYFGGVEDLKNGIVQFVGNPEDRIKEDYLRILRFFRFTARYGKTIDSNTLTIISKYKDKLLTISKERITSEIIKILNLDNYFFILKAMKICGVSNVIMPSFSNLEFLEKVIELSKEHSVELYAMAILAVLRAPEVSIDNFVLSNEDIRQLNSFSHIKEITNIKECYYLLYNYDISTTICYLLISKIKYNNLEDISEFIEVLYSITIPEFPISGFDVMSIMNLQEGIELGKILKNAKSWWIDSGFTMSKYDCLKKIEEIFNA